MEQKTLIIGAVIIGVIALVLFGGQLGLFVIEETSIDKPDQCVIGNEGQMCGPGLITEPSQESQSPSDTINVILGAGLVVDICEPINLTGKVCGSNGCDVSIGTCDTNQECINYQCVEEVKQTNYWWLILIVAGIIGYYIWRKNDI